MVTKSQKAFFRKLYLAHLMYEEKHNLLSLQALTQMPRRTLQDTIASLSDIGIDVEFVQTKARHNAGYYQVSDWGPISSAWVRDHLIAITEALSNDGEPVEDTSKA
jgi:hypothetical protein